MKIIILTLSLIILSSMFIYSQTKSQLTCADVVFDLYVQNIQLRKQIEELQVKTKNENN